MGYVLRDGMFQVKCRRAGCPFKSEFKISQTIMGATDRDCELEAVKIARNMAVIKHDAIYGRNHSLTEPIVRKVRGSYVPFGASSAPQPAAAVEPGLPHPPGAVAVRRYAVGDIILRKGDRATTVCEVISGSAYPENTAAIRYEAGRSFGAAGLLSGKERTGSVIADDDGTVVAFYNIQELTKTNPTKARELYNEVMEDTLHVIAFLDDRVDELEAEVARLQAAAKSAKTGAKAAAKPAKTAAKAKAAKPSGAAKGKVARKK